MKRRAIDVIRGAGVCLTLLASSGCTVVLESSAHQCEQDSDCTDLGADFADNFCNENFVCQQRAEHCDTNAQCIDRNFGGDFICRKRDSRCIALETPECPRVFAEPDDLRNDEVVLLGAHYYTSASQVFSDMESALRKMQADLRGSGTLGLLPNSPAGPPRPIVINVCDVVPWKEKETYSALDHLIKDLEVPLIFGTDGWQTAYVFEECTKEGGIDCAVMSINNSGGAQFDNLAGREGVLFRTLDATKMIQAFTGKFVNEKLIPYVKDEQSLPPTAEIKVVVLRSTHTTFDAYVDQLRKALNYNGKDWAANQAAGYYKEYPMGDERDVLAIQNDIAAAVTDLKASAIPTDIFIYVGFGETTTALDLLEKNYPGKHHVINGNVAPAIQGVIAQFAGAQARHWLPLWGPTQPNQEIATFELIFEQFDPETNGDNIALYPAADTYDQAYYVMYGLAALPPGEVITGRKIGNAILQRMRSGAEVHWGSDPILDTLNKLRAGENIIYKGLMSSSAQFNDKGDIVPNGLIACFDQGNQTFFPYQPAGVHYDSAAGTLSGDLVCPP